MATALISLERLSQYDTLIKNYVDVADAKSIKTISYDADTRVVSFFKTEDGSGTAAYTVTLPSTSEFIEKFAMTGTGAATAGDFVTIAADGSLTDAGATIAASKISVADEAGLIDATDVETAIAELAQAAAGGVDSKTIYLKDESEGQSTYAKVYGLYQGSDAADMTKNTSIGKINLPLDKVVKSATLVDEDDKGTKGKFLKIEFQNDAGIVYADLSALADVYSGAENATEVQITVTDYTVSAAIVEVNGSKLTDGSVAKTKLDAAVQTSLGKADSAVQPSDLTADNIEYVAASGEDPAVSVKDELDDLVAAIGDTDVATQITNAINALDSSTDDDTVVETADTGLVVLTSATIADGKFSAKKTKTLGGAAEKAADYYMVADEYSIASEAQIAALFTANTNG